MTNYLAKQEAILLSALQPDLDTSAAAASEAEMRNVPDYARLESLVEQANAARDELVELKADLWAFAMEQYALTLLPG